MKWGRWNETDELTRLPILEGDPVVVLFARKQDHANAHIYDLIGHFPTPMIVLHGTYDSYGSISEKDKIPKILGEHTVWNLNWDLSFFHQETVDFVRKAYVNFKYISKIISEEEIKIQEMRNALKNSKCSPEESSLLVEQIQRTIPAYEFAHRCRDVFRSSDIPQSMADYRNVISPIVWFCCHTRSCLFSSEAFSGSQAQDLWPYELKIQLMKDQMERTYKKQQEYGFQGEF